MNSLEFPPKKSLGNKSERFVEDRRKLLQAYLRSIVNYLITTNVSLAANPDKETLLSLFPFFGDTEAPASAEPAPTSRSLFRRSSSQSQTSQPPNLVL